MLLNFSPVLAVKPDGLKKLEMLFLGPPPIANSHILVVLAVLPAISGGSLGGAERAV